MNQHPIPQTIHTEAQHAATSIDGIQTYTESMEAFKSRFISLLGSFALFFGKHGEYKKSAHIKFVIDDTEELLKAARKLLVVLVREGK